MKSFWAFWFGGAAAAVALLEVETPDSRTFVVRRETRTRLIWSEDRTLIVRR